MTLAELIGPNAHPLFVQGASEAEQRRLNLTHAKRKHDKFNDDFVHSAFAGLSVERRQEIGDEELAAQRADERRAELYGDEQ